MALRLRQSTAGQEVPLGYFLDSGDGDAEELGLTIANTDIRLWMTGATTLANKNSGGATHIANGIYYAVLDATDTATLGPLVIFVHVSGALAVRLECLVLPANVYDALVLGTDALQVHADEITNDLITAAAIATGAIDGDAMAASALDVDVVTDALANRIADHLLNRNMATARASSYGDGTGRFILQAFSFLRNRKAIAAGILTAYEENDTTGDWTAAVTTGASAEPVIEIDPA